METANGMEEPGLLIQLFELRDCLVEKGIVKFRASETCMYPCVKPGDTLHVKTKRVAEIRVGDIAVFRRGNRLFSHRVIAKDAGGGKSFIVTRPDRSEFGDDGPTRDGDILGIVSAIERKGKMLNPEKPNDDLKAKISFLFLYFYETRRRLLFKLAGFTIKIQESNLYPRLARIIFPEKNRKLNSTILVPLNPKSDRFHKQVSRPEFVSMWQHGMKERRTTFKIMFSVNGNKAAFFQLEHDNENFRVKEWWVRRSMIRTRFRGIGLEEQMIMEIDHLFDAIGVSELYADAGESEPMYRKWLRDLGFREASENRDGTSNTHRSPVLIMKREIPKGRENESGNLFLTERSHH